LVGRFLALHFRQSYLGREDKDLTAKLHEELPGILLWAIEGWKALHAVGKFTQPELGKPILDIMGDMGSRVATFVEECCVLGPEYMASTVTLYQRFCGWCALDGHRIVETKPVFCKDLLAAYPTLVKYKPRQGDKREHFYKGIGVPPPPTMD